MVPSESHQYAATLQQLWCDATKPIDARVADAVSRLTLPEKICSLDTSGCPNPSLGLPDYNWWSEASTGVSNNADSSTKFPFPITVSPHRPSPILPHPGTSSSPPAASEGGRVYFCSRPR